MATTNKQPRSIDQFVADRRRRGLRIYDLVPAEVLEELAPVVRERGYGAKIVSAYLADELGYAGVTKGIAEMWVYEVVRKGGAA